MSYDTTTLASLPTRRHQENWWMLREGEKSRIHSAHGAYDFTLPTDSSSQVAIQHPTYHHDFDQDGATHSTIQVHRASPTELYFTVQDGKTNPTFTLKHSEGNRWSVETKQPNLNKQAAVPLIPLAIGGMLGYNAMGRMANTGASLGNAALNLGKFMLPKPGTQSYSPYRINPRGNLAKPQNFLSSLIRS